MRRLLSEASKILGHPIASIKSNPATGKSDEASTTAPSTLLGVNPIPAVKNIPQEFYTDYPSDDGEGYPSSQQETNGNEGGGTECLP